jgi:hypothetical protein
VVVFKEVIQHPVIKVVVESQADLVDHLKNALQQKTL